MNLVLLVKNFIWVFAKWPQGHATIVAKWATWRESVHSFKKARVKVSRNQFYHRPQLQPNQWDDSPLNQERGVEVEEIKGEEAKDKLVGDKLGSLH